MEGDDLIVLHGDNENESPLVFSRWVVDGDCNLKKKNMKGSRAWEQFRVVYDPSNDVEVFEVACCCVCKVCITLQKKGE